MSLVRTSLSTLRAQFSERRDTFGAVIGRP